MAYEAKSGHVEWYLRMHFFKYQLITFIVVSISCLGLFISIMHKILQTRIQ